MAQNLRLNRKPDVLAARQFNVQTQRAAHRFHVAFQGRDLSSLPRPSMAATEGWEMPSVFASSCWEISALPQLVQVRFKQHLFGHFLDAPAALRGAGGQQLL